MDVIDSHVHFWDPAVLRYDWLENIPALNRAFGPSEYTVARKDVNIPALVLVEANCAGSQNLREAEWLARLGSVAETAAVVAFVDLLDASATAQTFDMLASMPAVRGVRQNIQGHPPGFCLQDAFVAGVQRAGERGLTFDICVTHDQLPDAIELVRRCADTSFVLDHCGKPAIRAGCFEPWSSNIDALAAHKNVCCKVSGLLTEADTERWRSDDLLPWATRVADCFGTDRLLFGSDWPVVTLAGEYRDWFGFTESFTDSWSLAERTAFYGGNATRVYRL